MLALPGSLALPVRVIEIEGTPQPTLAGITADRDWPAVPGGALARMWRHVLDHRGRHGVILNLQHDWLPYFLTTELLPGIVHLPNLGRVNEATDEAIIATAEAHPGRVAFLGPAHAAQFGLAGRVPLLPLGLELDRYPFSPAPERGLLVFAGRIAPEKGLEDAALAARLAGRRLAVAGGAEDGAYLAMLLERYADVLDYRGHLGPEDLVALLGRGEALLQTQAWAEAFGIVTLEAMAVGTPVIAYDRGANATLLEPGVTGFIAEPATPEAVALALQGVGALDRRACRARIAAGFGHEVTRAALAAILAGLGI